MASRTLDEVKAALAALQEEIKEAKEERKAAKSQLEKATLEEKPDSGLASFKSIYDGAVANLTGLRQKEVELLKRETKLTTSHSSSDEETQENSPVSYIPAKSQEVDTLIAKCIPMKLILQLKNNASLKPFVPVLTTSYLYKTGTNGLQTGVVLQL